MKFYRILIITLFISVALLLFVRQDILRNWLDPEIITFEYYENGNLKKTTVVSELDGIRCYLYQFENGEISHKYCEDKNGIRIGPFENYYLDGKPREISKYVGGKLHGPTKLYYKNGKLLNDLFYIYGLKQGVQFSYKINGQLKAINYYQDDSLIHKRIYDYSDSSEVEIYETYKPIINLKNDTIKCGDTLEVNFNIAFDENYKYAKEYFLINFDYQKMSADGGGVNYPEITDTIYRSGRLERSFKIEEEGHHWLYGFLEGQSGDTMARYETFEKSFYVIPG